MKGIYATLHEAISTLKLDRRHKWEVFNGDVCYPCKISLPCSGCSCDCSDGYGCSHGNSGCRECGGSGKSRMVFPVYATNNDGLIVKVKTKKSTLIINHP